MADTLAVSPDLEAFCCYGVVLLAGFIVAYAKIRRFFQGKPGAWGVLSVWGLFAAYSLVPVVLFWLLDRTGSIHDTSLFAAIIVGFGYQQVLTGAVTGIRPPTDLGKWWQPFQNWANWTSDRVLERIQVRNDRFNARVVRHIREDHDGKQFQTLQQLAYATSARAAALKAEVDALNTDENQRLLGAEGVRDKQITLLYRSIRDVSDSWYLLRQNGLISRFEYRWVILGGRTATRAMIYGIALLALLRWGWIDITQAGYPYGSKYYLWRLEKTNSTQVDHNRARAGFIALIGGDPAKNGPTLDLLANALHYDTLTGDTADVLLAIVVESRAKFDWRVLGAKLIDTLHTENPDVRLRIHNTLLHLAQQKSLCIPDSLKTWKPSKSDSSATIDDRAVAWSNVWKSQADPAKCAPSGA
ncbi:MAG: hypothetical protein KGN84_07085 [Acidobacteriota bacterium]|nr:hypothetical protein [Acidobacteriota bacterium]